MFKFSSEQLASIRRKKIGDGLIATFEDSPIRAGWNDDNNCVVATDPLEHSTRFGFDTQGFIGSVASPTGRLWQIENNADGKPAQLKNPAGHTLGLTYSPDGQVDSISSNGSARLRMLYNQRQMQAGASFPDRTFAAVEYTSWNAPAISTDRLGIREAFEYDAQRRLTALIDGKGARTQFRYGQWSRPDATIDPNGAVESYTYNDKGFVSQIASEASSVDLECNDKGRPLQMQFSDGTEAKYQYNDKGLATESAIGDCLCKAVWNEEGRLAEEQNGDAVIKYEYDKIGRLTCMTYPSGEKIEYQWDADSRLIEVRDWNGGKHTIRHAEQDRGFTLYGANSLYTQINLNDLGCPESIALSRNSSPVLTLKYTYDQENRVSTLSDSAFGGRAFAYDAENQLLTASYQTNGEIESFQYDTAGNPVLLSGKPARFDAANQMLSHGHTRFAYDGRGNLVAMEAVDGIWRFSYNARNYMVRSESPKGEVATYAYDAYGRRIRKTRGATVVEFVWAGEQLIGEIARTGERVVRRDYLYFPGTFTPLAMRIDGKVYSYHTDHLGTPRMITDADGAVAWAADYSSFGQARIARATVENPLRAPGQYLDTETGLHYNRFRYYSPTMGRYLSRDPLSFLAESNFYRYAGNSPINVTDPLGLWWSTLLKVAKVAAVVAATAVAVVAVAALVTVAAPEVLAAAGVVASAGAIAAGAVVLSGVVGGAVSELVNEKVNGEKVCWPCIAKAAGIGAVTSLPFAAVAFFSPPAALAGPAAAVAPYALTAFAGFDEGVLQVAANCLDPHSASCTLAGSAATIVLHTGAEFVPGLANEKSPVGSIVNDTTSEAAKDTLDEFTQDSTKKPSRS